MQHTTTADEPGVGEGWTRLAALVAEQVPVAEMDGLWVFRPMMHEGRQWGTAVFTRVDGDRRRIYTARYMHQLKGKERGTYSADITEVGSGVVETLDDILALAEHRLEEEPPVRIPIERWFPPNDDGPVDTD
ncbi:MAG TPA: hypothetical protein VK845_09370 [Gemmatimonadales bacterium]|nr:hypothetical protein [Gemmatimonadales bacterium]